MTKKTLSRHVTFYELDGNTIDVVVDGHYYPDWESSDKGFAPLTENDANDTIVRKIEKMASEQGVWDGSNFYPSHRIWRATLGSIV